MITISPDILHDFDRCSKLEWLETNGLGGWASSTVAGAHSRRYHGLLVAALDPPVNRMLLVSKLDETLHLNRSTHPLSSNRYPGVVHPDGHSRLTTFRRDLFPVFEWSVAGVELRKTIAGIHGENTTVVLYEVSAAPCRFTLELQPLLTWRDIHHLGPDATISERSPFDAHTLRWRPVEDGPEVFIQVPGGSFEHHSDWFRNFEYEIERRRGFDFTEDLWTPGRILVELGAGDRLAVIISTQPSDSRDGDALLASEAARREELVKRLPAHTDLTRTLTLAADQFVVRRGEDLRTIIAGYHWFTDWGRDTMIALPGLCLATGRHDDARRILRAFAAGIDRGMLPNRFPDSGEEPEYNTVDATLWFFVAIHSYLQATGDLELVRDELLPVLRDIVDWHDRGARYGIRVDSDGLLLAGEPGVQLTWMDAKIGDWVVTPRHGKAVEVNALWHNALAILADLEERCGDAGTVTALRRRAERVRRAFGRSFWNDEIGCLNDVISEDGGVDASIRPNQIFALSLPFPLLSKTRARRVLEVVEERLLTPFGLRSLSPEDPAYRPHYTGDPRSRDSAYHQGTVWSWLLGPTITALVRYRGEEGREQARRLIEGFGRHLSAAGLGSVSEIFDGDPPHTPRGAAAQAWGVAEVLRAIVESTRGVDPGNDVTFVRGGAGSRPRV
jgi:predicted glycogen debranching enzyme